MRHLKQQNPTNCFSDKLKIKLDDSFLAYANLSTSGRYCNEVVIQIQRGSSAVGEWIAELEIKLSVQWCKYTHTHQKLQLWPSLLYPS